LSQIKRSRKKLKKNKNETAVAEQLKEAGVKFSFEPHSFKYNVPATYTPDFVLTTKKGKDIYVEVKGYHPGMQAWAQKIRHFVEQNPKIDYRIVFKDASKKFNKRYKSNLGDWATRIGVKWSSGGLIPEEWLGE
jgi:thioredoxin-related protein